MELINASIKLYPLSDHATVIQFGDEIDVNTFSAIRSVSQYLDDFTFDGFIEYVPAFTTITVYYNSCIVTYQNVEKILKKVIENAFNKFNKKSKLKSRLIEIPVLYGGKYGPDLDFVMDYSKLSKDEVVNIHSESEYLVYMIGFVPGFPYLGGMDERISAPRKNVPNLEIAGGSVGIAGKQTGIYPIKTPGGWQIIGRTPLDLFDINKTPPSLLKSGDKIRFVPIAEKEFIQIRKKVDGN